MTKPQMGIALAVGIANDPRRNGSSGDGGCRDIFPSGHNPIDPPDAMCAATSSDTLACFTLSTVKTPTSSLTKWTGNVPHERRTSPHTGTLKMFTCVCDAFAGKVHHTTDRVKAEFNVMLRAFSAHYSCASLVCAPGSCGQTKTNQKCK